jgi:multidrug efflux pump subunit AcrA (membrane-fusion protein)
LIQVEITGRREIHQAETALRVARREEAAQARRLQQAGLSVELLQAVPSDVDIVIADVPEGRLNQVTIGQGCVARFFGLPKEPFPGRVRSIAPVLSAERRSLRVLFTIDDPDDKLRPGMFAEIGLGTDPRESLLVPADAVLHIGRSDFVLVADGEDTWRVAEVQVGEPYRTEIQILDGLQEGSRVIGKGAILFKPLAIRALRQPEAGR